MNKHVKKILIAVALMLAALILAAAGYMIYVAASYSRMKDNLPLSVKNNPETSILLDAEYKIMTYNLGFGAYSPDFSFFTESSVMLSGKKYKGKFGTARSKDEVRKNINGAIDTILINNCDFILAQEADEDGTRSYHINQRKWLEDDTGYASVYAKNYHSPYLYYPFKDPHGKNSSGIITLSRFKVDEAVRRLLPVSTKITKYFDLDRCFSVSRFNAGEKDFVLVNLQLSPYDMKGEVGKKQIETLFEFLSDEAEKGNYVIAGGDFGCDIGSFGVTFDSQEVKPDWLVPMPELPARFAVAQADNGSSVPTCRTSAMPYAKGVNYTFISDGFLVSDNVKVTKVQNLNMEFAFSDHNPVVMEFILSR